MRKNGDNDGGARAAPAGAVIRRTTTALALRKKIENE